MMQSSWRLDPLFRFAIYAAFGVLFASGAAWLLADQLKETASGEAWQQASSYFLMLHGGTAMLTLLLLGALFPLHIGRVWRFLKYCVSGVIVLASTAVLIVTAFGLYYLGSETIRSWTSDIHIAFGLSLPLLLLAHVKAWRKRP